jgi:hypothetical protein
MAFELKELGGIKFDGDTPNMPSMACVDRAYAVE